MLGPVIVDTNLLLLLVVGYADVKYIAMHKRLSSDYSEEDWHNLIQIVSLFTEIVVTPNTLTEVSSFARHLENPARSRVQEKLREFVSKTFEIYIESKICTEREEFIPLGLTDAALLHICSSSLNELEFTLLSVDNDLLNRANSLGYAILDYKEWRDGLITTK